MAPMNVELLIEAITRETLVLISQLAATYRRAGKGVAGLETFVQVAVHHNGPMTRARLREMVQLDAVELDPIVDVLLADGRLTEEKGRLCCESCVIPLEASAGWEAAVLDHYNAVVAAISGKLEAVQRAAPADAVGGSTFRFDLWRGHPLETEILGRLSRERRDAVDLRARASAAARPPGAVPYQVVWYCGQSVAGMRER
ncbi:hypothetical protein [Vulgatibacter sp.]|uniref:hypothetical protein n=1 Tax=Vulgatibacter sp. TaxID=1971226 RepID=UPI003562F14E